MELKNKLNKIIVVGSGPAGMMAAICASSNKSEVMILEKNPNAARKLLYSGKGRCNLTNACEIEDLIKRYFRGGEFLRDALKALSNNDLMLFFEKHAVKLKTERQLRVFPQSDSSKSILNCLLTQLKVNNVKLNFSSSVVKIIVNSGVASGVIIKDNKTFYADKIILATGGASYAFTGSSGDGFKIAQALGHKVVPLRPGLVPLICFDNFCAQLEGLVLKNVRLNFVLVEAGGKIKKKLVSDLGELLFTKDGISGPLVLSISSRINDWFKEGCVYCNVDLKPALDKSQLNRRFVLEYLKFAKKSIKNILGESLPKRMIEVFLKLAKVDPEKKASQINQEERFRLVELFKSFPVKIKGTLPIEEAMVTCGGVSLKEINPRTMESRLVKNLYFAGEIMDIDADTGGFNLQAAFSTGCLAGKSAALTLDPRP